MGSILKTAERGKDIAEARGLPADRKPSRLGRLLLAGLLPVIVFFLAEAILRLCGVGYPTSYFIKTDQAGIYKSNARFDWPFLGPELSRVPLPKIIARDKPPHTFRVFVFGSSAAGGIPDEAYSFSRILETMLNAAFPDTRFEVVNTGMTAVNSHTILPLVHDCLPFDGDLFIVYMGNNEVIGPYGGNTVFRGGNRSRIAIRLGVALRCTRVGQVLDALSRRLTTNLRPLAEWGGMDMFARNKVPADDPRMEYVYRHFEANLTDICMLAAQHRVPVIAATVLTNLKDCPPFASLHRPGISPADLEHWERLYQEGIGLQNAGQYEFALERFQSAAAIDSRYADLHYRLGHCRLALQQSDLARADFVRARDLDTLRFRADSRINESIRKVAMQRQSDGVALVDLEKAIGGIPGADLLYEHVHLTLAGNYAIASALFPSVCEALRLPRSGPNASAVLSLDDCARRLVFTEYDRCADFREIAMLTAQPVFPREVSARWWDQVRRMESSFTHEALGEMADRYRQALADRPGDLLLRRNFAELLYFWGDYADAAEQWRTLIGLYPDFTHWYFRLGQMLLFMEKPGEAEVQFRALLKLKPNAVDGYVGLGDALARQGNHTGAAVAYGQALRIRPANAYVHFALGRIRLQQNNPALAETHFREAIRLDPANAMYRQGLTEALEKQGRQSRGAQGQP